VFALLAVAVATAGDGLPAIVERWTPEDPTARKFEKVAVVGIVADPRIRHRFEDKLVSHLRGRGLMAVASYTVVEDLAAPGNPQQILDRVLEQGIDGVISVRAFPLAKRDEEGWAGSWREPWTAAVTLREFVADSLPLSAQKADRYGLDFAVWHGSPFRSVWAGRTEVYPVSHLRKRGGEVVQSVIDTFEDARLF
jgi:hypothetical protein